MMARLRSRSYKGNARMRSLCIAEMRVTVNNIKILGVAQKCLCGEIYVAGNGKTYLGIHVNCPV
jgi:hypothetical protein